MGNVEVELPRRATAGSAGLDLRAAIESSVTIDPGKRALVPTGLRFAIPPGVEGQVRSRSGLAWKHGVMVLNAPGTIDSDFRGEVGVVLANLGDAPFLVSPGDRIAQIVFARFETADLELVAELDDTDRGSGGYGSTGL